MYSMTKYEMYRAKQSLAIECHTIQLPLFQFPYTFRMTRLSNFIFSFEMFEGHAVDLKVTVAKRQQRAGLCSPRTQFDFVMRLKMFYRGVI